MPDTPTTLVDALGTANARLGQLLFRANGSGQFIYDQQAAFFMLGERSTAIQSLIADQYDALVAACANAGTGTDIATHTVRLDELATELEGLLGGPAPKAKVAGFVVACAGALDRTGTAIMQAVQQL